MPEIELEFSLHPKQAMALTSHATEILYGGSAGSGKSFLCRVAMIAACLEISGLQVYLFRLHQDEITRSHVEGDAGFRALLAPLVQAGAAKVLEQEVRIGNSRIYLCHCNQKKDLDKYYSTEMHMLVVEEATQLRESWLRFLRTRARMSSVFKDKMPAHLRERFPRILYATNPIGESQAYFRKYFVKAAPPFDIYRAEESEGGMLRQYIPARLTDNPSLNAAEYSAKLQGLKDDTVTDALLQGNWDALAGDFLREYDDDAHTTPAFIPPHEWFKFRTFDWGFSEPFVCQWWTVSDGEPFTDHLQRQRWFPRGSLIMYREWFGANPDNTAEGLRLTNEEMARGIVSRTPEEYKWVTITDSKPFQSTGAVKGLGTAEIFQANGVKLIQGDTGRVNGWMQLRSRLKGGDTGPMIYFCDICTNTREYLPALQRHELKPDDAAESGEATHCADAVRYACTARPLIKEVPKQDKPFVVKSEQLTFNQAIAQARKLQKLREQARGY
jgi:hypothetical protein